MAAFAAIDENKHLMDGYYLTMGHVNRSNEDQAREYDSILVTKIMLFLRDERTNYWALRRKKKHIFDVTYILASGVSPAEQKLLRRAVFAPWD